MPPAVQINKTLDLSTLHVGQLAVEWGQGGAHMEGKQSVRNA